MKLPDVPHRDGIRKGVQVRFGGLNHNVGAVDGEIYDMENMISDEYPVLSVRDSWTRFDTTNVAVNALLSNKNLLWLGAFARLYGAGEVIMGDMISIQGHTMLCALGDFVVQIPQKRWFNISEGTSGMIESVITPTAIWIEDGLLFGEKAQANTIRVPGFDLNQHFRAGDAVTLTGAHALMIEPSVPSNNKTAVIREIDGDKLYFYENTFELGGHASVGIQNTQLRIARTMPDIKFICQSGNRLWGCDDTTIYASKPGDIFNWNVFEGLETDNWAWEAGSPNGFTGCITAFGMPMFFKENHIYTIYGTLPSNFEAMEKEMSGVATGSHGSLAVADNGVYYLSRTGVMRYSGGRPRHISAALGRGRYADAVGGTCGVKYYINMRGVDDEEWRLYVYDTRNGLWHVEARVRFLQICGHKGNAYAARTHVAGDAANDRFPAGLWVLSDAVGVENIPGLSAQTTRESTVPWYCEFTDWTDGSPNRKFLPKIQVRLEVDAGAEATISIQYDSDGVWHEVVKLTTGVKRSYYLPLKPRRSDHYRLRFSGRGGCRIFSITRERAVGSEH